LGTWTGRRDEKGCGGESAYEEKEGQQDRLSFRKGFGSRVCDGEKKGRGIVTGEAKKKKKKFLKARAMH